MTVQPQALPPLWPGGSIGMVGGGQLGRMFAAAAMRMGYEVVVFCHDKDEPAAQIANHVVTGPIDDTYFIDALIRRCDRVTLEFENIPAATIRRIAAGVPTFPTADVLAIAQDRLREKTTLEAAGLPVTPFAAVTDRDSALAAGESLGWPLVVKTNRSGYDGKGQYRLDSQADLDAVDWLGGGDWIAESCIEFDLEVSVIVARSTNGEVCCFPVFENAHRHHVLDVTVVPAAVSPAVREACEQVARGVAESLDVVGLVCIEFFVRGDDLMINEIAPRPHNSGHVTLEACRVSQFEQHVRAVCGLSLGDPAMKVPAAAMLNLFGDLWHDGSPSFAPILDRAGAALHLYGKRTPRPGRKMGHVSVVGDDRPSVLAVIESVKSEMGCRTETDA